MLWCLFFFMQKTAYEMRSSDWSSDVCSSDLWHRRRMPATGTSLLASATTHRKLMSPKVLNPDDGAAFLAIVRELYDVDQQIETLAGERTDGIAGDGALDRQRVV